MIMYKTLVMKIKELRIRNSISQKCLAKKMGVSSQTILNWENGIFEPKISQLIKLADIFDVTVDYLIDRKSNNKNASDIYNELSKINFEKFLKWIKLELEEIEEEENSSN